MTFDAQKEADKIEHLAKERMDTPIDKAQGASDALMKEWSSLSSLQRTEVELAITNKYAVSADAMPSPTVEFNLQGQPIGLYFTASRIDFHEGPHTLELTTGEPSPGQERTYLRANSKPTDPVDQEAEKIYGLITKKLATPYGADTEINKALLTEWEKCSSVQGLVVEALDETVSSSGWHMHSQVVQDKAANSIGIDFTSYSSRQTDIPSAVGLGSMDYDGVRANILTAGTYFSQFPEMISGVDASQAKKFFSDSHDGHVKLGF